MNPDDRNNVDKENNGFENTDNEIDLRKISAKLIDEDDIDDFDIEKSFSQDSNEKNNTFSPTTSYDNDINNNSDVKDLSDVFSDNNNDINDEFEHKEDISINTESSLNKNALSENKPLNDSHKNIKSTSYKDFSSKNSDIPLNKNINNSKETKPKKNIVKIIIAAVIVIIIIAVFIVYSKASSIINSNLILNGILIENVDVSQMTKDEAINHLSETISDGENGSTLRLYVDDYEKEVSYYDLGVKYDFQKAVDEAYLIGRNDSFFNNVKTILSLKSSPQNIIIEKSHDDESLNKILAQISEDLNSEAVDAKIKTSPGSGKFTVEEEKIGYTVLVEPTKEKILNAINDNITGDIVIETEKVMPKIKKEDLSTISDNLGSYYTSFSAGAVNRNINLEVGSKNVNGTILMPGETFSMNEGLGPQTYAAGYRNAAVYVNGKVEDGIAGGVCQLTTTLYNAVILAELEVVQRSNHSLPVAYVKTGFDAAVAGTYKDLKFKNNTDYPIYIEMYVSGTKVYSNIYGTETRSPNRHIKFERVYVRTIPQPPEKIIEDPELKEGERVVEHKGQTGSVVELYKYVYEGDKLISKDWFSTSNYIATADEVRVGTKKDESKPASTTDNASGNFVPGENTSGTNTNQNTNQNNNQNNDPNVNEDLVIGAN